MPIIDRYDTFGDYLDRIFPGVRSEDSLARLLKEHGSLRAVSRAMGISLVTISRWGKRLGATPPPQWAPLNVAEILAKRGGGRNAKEKLRRLKEEEGTWVKVAVRLGVTLKELQRYRYVLKIVPKDKFRARCEGGEFGRNFDPFGDWQP